METNYSYILVTRSFDKEYVEGVQKQLIIKGFTNVFLVSNFENAYEIHITKGTRNTLLDDLKDLHDLGFTDSIMV